MGDGHIEPDGSIRLEQSNKTYCWIEDVANKFNIINVMSRIVPIPPRIRVIEGRKVCSKPGSLLYTPAYVELQQQRKRWYPGGIKRVPRDIILSPIVLAYWFSGDGTYNSNGALYFCTNGFVKEDTEYLVKLISNLGIETHLSNTGRVGQFVIGIYKIKETFKLKEIIDTFLPECCKYKLRFVKPSTSFVRKLTDEQVCEIRASSESLKCLSKKFGVSTTSISNVIHRKTFKDIL